MKKKFIPNEAVWNYPQDFRTEWIRDNWKHVWNNHKVRKIITNRGRRESRNPATKPSRKQLRKQAQKRRRWETAVLSWYVTLAEAKLLSPRMLMFSVNCFTMSSRPSQQCWDYFLEMEMCMGLFINCWWLLIVSDWFSPTFKCCWWVLLNTWIPLLFSSILVASHWLFVDFWCSKDTFGIINGSWFILL